MYHLWRRFTRATPARHVGLLGSTHMVAEPDGVTSRRHIALVAHDNKKADLLEWARFNRDVLAAHELVATGTTGRLLGDQLDLPITCLRSGPLGGDQQLGAMITARQVDLLVFFWDPLESQPHDPDVRPSPHRRRGNTAVARNRASADF